MGLGFQFAQFCKDRLNIRIEVSVWNAQSDKDKDRDIKTESSETKGQWF